VAACLPYALAAVLADFVHVHSPQSGRASPRAVGATVEARPTPPPPADSADYSCPACAWLKIGHRTESRISIGAATQTATAQIVLIETEWPDSPVSRHTALRGPPPQTFS